MLGYLNLLCVKSCSGDQVYMMCGKHFVAFLLTILNASRNRKRNRGCYDMCYSDLWNVVSNYNVLALSVWEFKNPIWTFTKWILFCNSSVTSVFDFVRNLRIIARPLRLIKPTDGDNFKSAILLLR